MFAGMPWLLLLAGRVTQCQGSGYSGGDEEQECVELSDQFVSAPALLALPPVARVAACVAPAGSLLAAGRGRSTVLSRSLLSFLSLLLCVCVRVCVWECVYVCACVCGVGVCVE